MVFEKSMIVSEDYLARCIESGDVEVFATPSMVALMEAAAAEGMAPFLEPGQTSVGSYIASSHSAPTPSGMRVTAKATITAIQGRRVEFNVIAYDEKEEIGRGSHVRHIVDRQAFQDKASAKIL